MIRFRVADRGRRADPRAARLPRGSAGIPARAPILALALAPILAACGEPPDPRTPGTVEMAARLAALADSANPMADPQLNRARLRYFAESEPPPNPAAMILRQGLIAQEMLNAGLTDPAVEQLFLIRNLLSEADAEPVPGFRQTLDELAGLGLLRLAFEQWCPGAARPEGEVWYPCWPTVGIDRGPPPDSARALLERAASWQEALIADRPDDLRAQWLYNVAHMGLGDWPEGVPEAWRVPEGGLVGTASFPRFPDIAPEVGLDVVSLSGGGIVDDLNGDGRLDVLVSARGLRDPLHYFESTGGGFIERTREAGLEGLVGGLNMVHADYDNDGDLDVLVLRGGWLVQGYPNSLLRNDGGRFADVTRVAGVYSEHPTQSAGWADYDGDGWLDLFVGNESRDGTTHGSELYRNLGDGTFEEVSVDVGVGVAEFVKGVAWGDYDDDGRPDLYLSVFQAPNRLFRNLGPVGPGGWQFEDVTETAGVAEPVASFPTWFWDADNDGDLDLFVAGYAAQTADLVAEARGLPHGGVRPRAYENSGDGTFADRTTDWGLDRLLYAMGSNYGDLDGDGWLDFYVGTGDPDYRQLMPNRMFRGTGTGFEEITGSGGFGGLDKGHAVSFADIDNDGDQDVHIQLGGANEGDLSPDALYENPGFGNRWITLRLEGGSANRSGIGARVAVTVETASGPRTIHRVVGSGGSFGGNPIRQEIGLGSATAITSVEIRWPGSGTTDRLDGLAMDRAYAIREGSGFAEPTEHTSFRLGGGG